jgi:hypothetical protein
MWDTELFKSKKTDSMTQEWIAIRYPEQCCERAYGYQSQNMPGTDVVGCVALASGTTALLDEVQ